MDDLIDYISRQLVDTPDEVVVSEERNGSNITYTLDVAEDDLGQVIGRRGRTASAMRALLSAAAAKQGLRASLTING